MRNALEDFSARKLRDLPVLSKVVIELQQALSRDDVSLDDLAESVSHDLGLSAKALRLANCSFFGVSNRVATIRNAIGVLGLRTVSMLLTAAAVSDCFARPAASTFDPAVYWRHSIGTAISAREVATFAGVEADVAFTTGLLHDLGRVILACQAPALYDRVHAHRKATDGPWIDAEREILGFDHADLGALAARHWNFAAAVCDGIQGSHLPPHSASPTLADVVHVADSVSHALDLAHDPQELVPPLDSASWNRLGLTPDRIQQVFERTEGEVQALCAALAV